MNKENITNAALALGFFVCFTSLIAFAGFDFVAALIASTIFITIVTVSIAQLTESN
jgi:hypothetical protein